MPSQVPPLEGETWSKSSALEHARALILEHGRNATAYQILNPGLSLWFSRDLEGVVAYVEISGRRIVAGEPVGSHSTIETLACEFEDASRRAGVKVCYFGAEDPLARGPTVDRLLLGAQPFWTPGSWPRILERKASLRAQLARARNKGVTVEIWPSALATGHPELERCLDEWLGSRGLPPMHFLVEPKTLERLYDRCVAVATCNGKIIGFLIASPIPQRQGWLIEQIIRDNSAPNGTSELLVDAAMQLLASETNYVTLGLSPLSRRCGLEQPTARPWVRFLLGWVRAHGRRFYNFEGLDFFKAKLEPDGWEPIYAVTRGRRIGLRDLYAIAGAFSGRSPIVFFAQGLHRALHSEVSRLLSGQHSLARKAQQRRPI